MRPCGRDNSDIFSAPPTSRDLEPPESPKPKKTFIRIRGKVPGVLPFPLSNERSSPRIDDRPSLKVLHSTRLSGQLKQAQATGPEPTAFVKQPAPDLTNLGRLTPISPDFGDPGSSRSESFRSL